MKWLVLFVCLARYAESGAIKCPTGLEDPSCKTVVVEKEHPTAVLEDSGKEMGAFEAECLAGSEWESNCHSCSCSDAGVAVCRRLENCVAEVNAPPVKCKANTTFTRGCNTCVCLESGLGLCTLKVCKESDSVIQSELVSGKECAAGSSWRSQCNRCSCSPAGYAFCTLKGCPAQESEPMMQCAPDSVWKNECNTCWCTSTGRAICTRVGCANVAPVSAQNSEQPKIADETVTEASIEYEEELTIADVLNTDKDSKSSKMKNYHEIEKPDHSHEEIDEEMAKLDRNLEIDEIDEHDNLLEEKDVTHTVLKRSSVCKPNQVFQSECNACKCASDGQSYTCTQNECMEGEKNKEVEVFMESEGEDHVEKHSVCKPQGTFYIGCNTCHCNPYGTDYSCTNKPCPLPEDVELFHELKDMKPIIPYVKEDSLHRNATQSAKEATKSAKNNTHKIVCVANRMFIKDCNTCWCNEDGTSFFCTRKVCAQELPEEGSEEGQPEELRVIKKECRPDEVFELDCNMCRCNPDGKSFSCTRRACVDLTDEENKNSSLTRKTRGTKEDVPKTCLPGQEFRLDCNMCLCDNEGKDFSCTRKDCNQANGASTAARTKRVATECVPGSVFDRDCNVCLCTEDGRHATCTLKRCSAPVDNDVDTNVRESDSNFRCNPGEQFKRDCNDCSCSADGKSVFCTLRLCDSDITPPPAF